MHVDAARVDDKDECVIKRRMKRTDMRMNTKLQGSCLTLYENCQSNGQTLPGFEHVLSVFGKFRPT